MVILYGILSIIGGISIILWILKYPENKSYSVGIPETYGAWLSGILFIGMGIIILIRNL